MTFKRKEKIEKKTFRCVIIMLPLIVDACIFLGKFLTFCWLIGCCVTNMTNIFFPSGKELNFNIIIQQLLLMQLQLFHVLLPDLIFWI
ncbi:hypothetical protein ACJX0J_016284, partial [Zea mays]